MVEYLEGYEELALSVHTSFSKDTDPLIKAEMKTMEYIVAIGEPAEKGLGTRLEKRRQDGLIKESWGEDWKEHAQPCLLPICCCSLVLTCPRLRPKFVRDGQTRLDQVEADCTAPGIRFGHEVCA
jgi:hypothetical protein